MGVKSIKGLCWITLTVKSIIFLTEAKNSHVQSENCAQSSSISCLPNVLDYNLSLLLAMLLGADGSWAQNIQKAPGWGEGCYWNLMLNISYYLVQNLTFQTGTFFMAKLVPGFMPCRHILNKPLKDIHMGEISSANRGPEKQTTPY